MDKPIFASGISNYIPMKYVRLHPEKQWDRNWLSQNTGIRVDDVLNLEMPNATGQWSWHHLSINVPIQDIIDHPEITKWKFLGYERRSTTLDEWEKIKQYSSSRCYLHKFDARFFALPCIDDTRKHPHYDIICDLYLQTALSTYDFKTRTNVAVAKTGTLRDIISIPDLSIYSGMIARNPFLDSNDFVYLVEHCNIPIQKVQRRLPISYIRDHPTEKYSYVELSQNPNLRIQDVLTLNLPNATGEWSWHYLTQFLPMDDIRSHPHLPWDPDYLLRNEEITIEDINILTIL